MIKVTDPIIQTASGKTVNLAEPTVDDIDIHDIAHALGHLCRFTGHTKEFYSVAEHCVNCADLVLALIPPDEFATLTTEQKRMLQLEALLHDAAEAYIGDVSRPLKSMLNSYKALEKIWEPIIAEAFSIRGGKTVNAVADVDHVMNVTEFRHLMNVPSEAIKFNMVMSYDAAIIDFQFSNFGCEQAADIFLDRFMQLTSGECLRSTPKSILGNEADDSVKSGTLQVATEHLVKHLAGNIIDDTSVEITNYVQGCAGDKFLAEPDNTIKGKLTVMLMAYHERMMKANRMSS